MAPSCWNLTPFMNLSFFPLYHQNPPQTLMFHYCWMEGCKLVGTCPASCIFLLLYSLAILCCWDVTPKPNPLYPKGWALNPTLKLWWNCSPATLTTAVDHALLNLTPSSFSTFFWAALSVGVNVCLTRLDLFSFLSFIFYSLILSQQLSPMLFVSTLLGIGLMWPHVN